MTTACVGVSAMTLGSISRRTPMAALVAVVAASVLTAGSGYSALAATVTGNGTGATGMAPTMREICPR